MRTPFVWQEMDHWTLTELMETVQLISTEEEALSFFEDYAAVCDDEDHALHNIGYMAEIVSAKDAETAKAICDLFDVKFVIQPRHTFGNNSSFGVKS